MDEKRIPEVEEEKKGCEQMTEVNLDHFSRLIIHLDMDAYYAQVEMK